MRLFSILALLFCSCASSIKNEDDHGSFVDDFDANTPTHFSYSSTGNNADFKKAFGVTSLTEPGTTVMSLKIDPADSAGAGRGPEIISNEFTHYGTYSARLRVPDVRDEQPNIGAVVGYFTYHMDDDHGLSEIDFEWLIADPTVVYVGTWSGPQGALKRIGRAINLREGRIYETTYRVGHHGAREPLKGMQNEPETIKAIPEYDASSRFYTYGFDWHSERLRWWMLHPVTSDTVVLWDYQGSKRGIPQNESRYRLNFWHTDDWAVETNPNSLEKPLKPYEVEVDWMRYEAAQ